MYIGGDVMDCARYAAADYKRHTLADIHIPLNPKHHYQD